MRGSGQVAPQYSLRVSFQSHGSHGVVGCHLVRESGEGLLRRSWECTCRRLALQLDVDVCDGRHHLGRSEVRVGVGVGHLLVVLGGRHGPDLHRCPSLVFARLAVVEGVAGRRGVCRSRLWDLCQRRVALDLAGRRIGGHRFAMLAVVVLGRSTPH